MEARQRLMPLAAALACILLAAAAAAMVPCALADDTRTKVVAPVVAKSIEADGAWVPAAVVPANQATRWRVEVQLPEDLGDGAYWLAVVDEPFDAEGLETVFVSMTAPTGETLLVDGDSWTSEAADGRLRISFDDLKAANPEVSGGETLVVTYTQPGWMPGSAPLGQDGAHANRAWAEYEGGKSIPATAQAMSVALCIDKVDASTSRALEGALFSVEGPDGRYYTQAGGWATEPAGDALFATGRDGRATVRGLPAGTYLVREVEAPRTYRALEGAIEVGIGAKASPNGNLELSCEAGSPAQVVKVDAAAGMAVVTVPNSRTEASVAASLGQQEGGGQASSQGPVAGFLAHALPKTGVEAVPWVLLVLLVALVAVMASRQRAQVGGPRTSSQAPAGWHYSKSTVPHGAAWSEDGIEREDAEGQSPHA